MQNTPPKFDELEAFAAWFMQTQGPLPIVPLGGMTRVGEFSGIVLCRQGQYQCQLWLCDPGSEIPNHSHPNVDSIQVYVGGEVYLRLNGQPVITAEMIADDKWNALEVHPKRGFSLRVRPSDNHGATIGPSGGAFMTFQKWLVGTPTSVEMDWRGPALSAKHHEAVNKQKEETK